jgi:antitoxin component YwqK of YwqJK toxin-antitoxin module
MNTIVTVAIYFLTVGIAVLIYTTAGKRRTLDERYVQKQDSAAYVISSDSVPTTYRNGDSSTAGAVRSDTAGFVANDSVVIVERRFTDGTLKVQFEAYRQNGELVRHGTYRSWYANGQMMLQCTYRDGVLHGAYSTWWESGGREIETRYRRGKTYGVVRWWYESGQIERKEQYVDGVIHGDYVRWYENGKIEEEGRFDMGVPDGPFIKYNRYGEKTVEGVYKNGKKIEETVY